MTFLYSYESLLVRDKNGKNAPEKELEKSWQYEQTDIGSDAKVDANVNQEPIIQQPTQAGLLKFSFLNWNHL